ncbi:MAG TPA: hypothetical protein VFQ80_07315 [Thermomicrobiales bacterium]|nr:hypothetical protein [Thermomicrobiales bacterium]
MIDRLGGRLQAAFAIAGQRFAYDRDGAARRDALFAELTEDRSGLAGAQAMRLLAIDALLDRAFAIRQVDLEAALALCD